MVNDHRGRPTLVTSATHGRPEASSFTCYHYLTRRPPLRPHLNRAFRWAGLRDTHLW